VTAIASRSARSAPGRLPWKDLSGRVVLECTGLFRAERLRASRWAARGKWFSLGAGREGCDRTVVIGVNDKTLKASDTVISNGSCTTNCLGPLVRRF